MLLMANGTIGALLQLIGASTIVIFILGVLIAWSNTESNRITTKKTKSGTTNNKKDNKKIA